VSVGSSHRWHGKTHGVYGCMLGCMYAYIHPMCLFLCYLSPRSSIFLSLSLMLRKEVRSAVSSVNISMEWPRFIRQINWVCVQTLWSNREMVVVGNGRGIKYPLHSFTCNTSVLQRKCKDKCAVSVAQSGALKSVYI